MFLIGSGESAEKLPKDNSFVTITPVAGMGKC